MGDDVTVLFVENSQEQPLLVRHRDEHAWGAVDILLLRSLTMALAHLEAATPHVIVTDLDDDEVATIESVAQARQIPIVVLIPGESGSGFVAQGVIGRAVRKALRWRRTQITDREPTQVTNLYGEMRHSLADSTTALSGVTQVSEELQRTVRGAGKRRVRRALTPAPFQAAMTAKSEKG
jgi:hypothetical protein